jgi:cell division protein FtsB
MVRNLSVSQFFIIIIIAVALIFAWDFGRRIVETVQMVQTLQAADRQLTQLEEAKAKLLTLKQDVTRDDWVEKQARARLHYTKEGETVFIPAATPPAPAAPASVIAVPVPVPERTIWDDLLEALFGPTTH